MKHIFKSSLIIFIIVCSWGFCAYGKDNIRKSFKVSLSTAFQPAARTVVSVGANTANSDNLWLQADMKFRTDEEEKIAKRFLDKPQLEIKIATFVEKRQLKNEKIVVFNGKINYISLELDGKEHHLKALLPALFFHRYAYNRKMDRTTFVARAVYSVNGKALAIAYGSNKNLQEREIREFFRDIPQNAITADNTIYGRQGTTWSIVEVNKYEMEQMK